MDKENGISIQHLIMDKVSGLWVAKFEASPEGETTDNANSQYNGIDKKLQVKTK